MILRQLARTLCCTLALAAAAPAMHSQMMDMKSDPAKPLPSPAATATATLGSATIKIDYNTPSMRGRKIMGALVPYGQVWRTGANPATTLTTSADMTFGTLTVPAGTHTLYTLPGESKWLLIVNNQTGQWGTVYDPAKDLGRTRMTSKPLSSPQELMSVSFEKTTTTSTQLHVKWETTDEYVTVTLK